MVAWYAMKLPRTSASSLRNWGLTNVSEKNALRGRDNETFSAVLLVCDTIDGSYVEDPPSVIAQVFLTEKSEVEIETYSVSPASYVY